MSMRVHARSTEVQNGKIQKISTIPLNFSTLLPTFEIEQSFVNLLFLQDTAVSYGITYKQKDFL